MIKIDEKEIVAIYYVKNGIKRTIAVTRDILAIIWEAVRSCFGSGTWKNDKPWKNGERWKNNA